jgi:hypothetical protein
VTEIYVVAAVLVCAALAVLLFRAAKLTPILEPRLSPGALSGSPRAVVRRSLVEDAIRPHGCRYPTQLGCGKPGFLDPPADITLPLLERQLNLDARPRQLRPWASRAHAPTNVNPRKPTTRGSNAIKTQSTSCPLLATNSGDRSDASDTP